MFFTEVSGLQPIRKTRMAGQHLWQGPGSGQCQAEPGALQLSWSGAHCHPQQGLQPGYKRQLDCSQAFCSLTLAQPAVAITW